MKIRTRHIETVELNYNMAMNMGDGHETASDVEPKKSKITEEYFDEKTGKWKKFKRK